MARRTKIYVVTDDNRDKGKHYQLTEMFATQGELWAARATFAMAKGGVDIPDDLRALGLAGIARVALSQIGKIPFDDAQVLFAEMFDQVKFVPDPKQPTFVRPLIEDDIEEISTRVKLRWELLKLHATFLETVLPSTSASGSTVNQ